MTRFFPVVAIFFAVKLSKADLPEWFDWIMVAYVVFHVVMHLVLSVSFSIGPRDLLIHQSDYSFWVVPQRKRQNVECHHSR